MSRYHSVHLNRDLCMGCTNCIKKCPTEAIRVRDGKAQIADNRCIDCGECIKVCPHHAKSASMDSLDVLENYDYTIALAAAVALRAVWRPGRPLHGAGSPAQPWLR